MIGVVIRSVEAVLNSVDSGGDAEKRRREERGSGEKKKTTNHEADRNIYKRLRCGRCCEGAAGEYIERFQAVVGKVRCAACMAKLLRENLLIDKIVLKQVYQ